MTPPHARVVVAVLLLMLTAGCGGPAERPGGTPPAPSPPPADELQAAVSDTEEDSVYPEAGDPLVDALHYDLDLTWVPDEDHLAAAETLIFRATSDADEIPLDLSDSLAVSSLTVDGDDADYDLDRTTLTIDHAVREDRRYEVRILYAGTPEPVPAPTTRADFAGGVGWTTTDDHEVWTLQEPYGAFTWYAANDQPADKALYDFTLTVPEPWTGIANGELTDTTEHDGLRTTTWHLDEPASTYLVTVAFGDYQSTSLDPVDGVPITIWSPSGEDATPGDTAYTPDALRWLEKILGPYPFDTLGILVVPGESGMETQTMITLGDTAYSTSKDVLVHEIAHHWYGDSVTPADWRDVWMNEGMAMYLQGMWEAEQQGIPVAEQLDQWASSEASSRESSGPPGDYDPTRFGDVNIYFGPALMWQELRERIGDDAFFDLLRAWPRTHELGTATREEYVAWIEQRTGEELSDFFDAWLLDPETPDRD